MASPVSSRENRLFLTNNYSIISKYSASKKGYFKDQILENFIESEICNEKNLLSARTPLVNYGYSARQMAVEWAVARSLKLERLDCLIVLGSGFDTLSLRPRAVRRQWIEIDLPYVMEYKRQYISTLINSDKNNVIVSVDGNVTSFTELKVHLISCDLRNQTELLERLSGAFKHIDHDERRRVAIINEVCLCYLEPFEVKQTLVAIRQFLYSQSSITMHYIGFEQVKPRETSPFANVMLNHFDYMGFPLKYFPSRKELHDLFMIELNFHHFTISSVYQIFHNSLHAYRFAAGGHPGFGGDTVEPFDEYEELDLYLSHYALVTGVACLSPIALKPMDESFNQISDGLSQVRLTSDALCDDLSEHLNTMQLDRQQNSIWMELNKSVQRFGHSSCLIEDCPDRKVVLVSGGFGKSTDCCHAELAPEQGVSPPTVMHHSRHQRLNECALVVWDSHGVKQTLSLRAEIDPALDQQASDLSLDRMHAQICQLQDGILFFNGGRQNPEPRVNNTDKVSFVARLDKSEPKLSLLTKVNGCNSLRWRHKILKLSKDKIIQIGGINGNLSNPRESPLGIWTFGSGACGFMEIDLDEGQDGYYRRHSFGADMRDANSLLVFGGLTSFGALDHPVDAADSIMLIDTRSPRLEVRFDCLRQSYGSQIHFINEHQFVKMAGISASTGLPEDFVELYDLRSNNINRGSPIASQLLPYVSSSRECIFIPTNMTSVRFSAGSQDIVSIGGGGNYFTFGTNFNKWHLICNYGSSQAWTANLPGRS